MFGLRARSENVSPTAHATGYLWYRHGLSHPGLVTARGRRLDRSFRLLIETTRRLSGISLEAMLVARHKGIDSVLARAIEAGEVSQVIEIAAGFSPRGWSFKRRFGDRLTYVETDLPHMVEVKRRMLANAGLTCDGHRVEELDALADEGAQSLAAIARTLDPARGTAIITEGLMNYLDPPAAQGVWRRIARTLRGFPVGLYLSDAYFHGEQRSPAIVAFGLILSAFVRGRMHIHFRDPEQAVATMQRAGFASATLHQPRALPETAELAKTPGAERVRVLEARTASRPLA